MNEQLSVETLKKFEELVRAMEALEKKRVEKLASDLFISTMGWSNWDILDQFQNFSGATIHALERDQYGGLAGGIYYKNQKFIYG